MSMLFISHDLGVVGEIADHVVVMRQGTVREQGAGRIFASPQDAYTKALLACRPTLEQRAPRLMTCDRRPHLGPRRVEHVQAEGPERPHHHRSERAHQELLAAVRRLRPQGVSGREGRDFQAATRPHAGRRRRIGLGQNDDGAGVAPPARAERRPGRRQGHVRRHRPAWRSARPTCCRCAGASRSSSRTPMPRSTHVSPSARP
jgi:hypothetical protein